MKRLEHPSFSAICAPVLVLVALAGLALPTSGQAASLPLPGDRYRTPCGLEPTPEGFVAAWSDSRGARLLGASAEGRRSYERTLSTQTSRESQSYCPTVAPGAGGRLDVFWGRRDLSAGRESRSYLVRSSRDADGRWSRPERVPIAAKAREPRKFSVSIAARWFGGRGDAGLLLVRARVAQNPKPPADRSNFETSALLRDTDGSWSTPRTLSRDLKDIDGYDAVQDARGTWLLMTESDGRLSVRTSSGAAWTTARALPLELGKCRGARRVIRASAGGEVSIVLVCTDGLRIARLTPAGVWQAQSLFDDGAVDPAAVPLDSNGAPQTTVETTSLLDARYVGEDLQLDVDRDPPVRYSPVEQPGQPIPWTQRVVVRDAQPVYGTPTRWIAPVIDPTPEAALVARGVTVGSGRFPISGTLPVNPSVIPSKPALLRYSPDGWTATPLDATPDYSALGAAANGVMALFTRRNNRLRLELLPAQ